MTLVTPTTTTICIKVEKNRVAWHKSLDRLLLQIGTNRRRRRGNSRLLLLSSSPYLVSQCLSLPPAHSYWHNMSNLAISSHHGFGHGRMYPRRSIICGVVVYAFDRISNKPLVYVRKCFAADYHVKRNSLSIPVPSISGHPNQALSQKWLSERGHHELSKFPSNAVVAKSLGALTPLILTGE